MSAKLKLVFPFLIIAVLLAGYSFTQNPPPQAVDNITLELTQQENGTWKVVVKRINGNPNRTGNDSVNVNRNTMITWEVDKTTDAYFQFPEDIVDKHSDTDTLSDNYTILIPAGKKLKLKVKDNATTGPHGYAVFIMKDGVYAHGDSPPQIIVN